MNPKFALGKKRSSKLSKDVRSVNYPRCVIFIRSNELTKLSKNLCFWQRYVHVPAFLKPGLPHVVQLGMVMTFRARRYRTATSSVAKNWAISAKFGKPFLRIFSPAERAPSAFLFAGAIMLWLLCLPKKNTVGERLSPFPASCTKTAH